MIDLKGRNGAVFGIAAGLILYIPTMIVFVVLLGLGGSVWGQL